MLLVYLALAILSAIDLCKAKVTCENETVAQDKFEYYTLWYRFRHGLVFWTTRKICALSEIESKFVCAQVAQACFPTLKDVRVEDIEREIKTKPGHCIKEEFTTPKKGSEDFKGGLKKMFGCPLYTVFGQVVTSFFVSYGGDPGTVLIFDRESTKNLNIDAKPPKDGGPNNFIKLAHYVTGLELVKPLNENDQQNKADPNKDAQNGSNQNKDTQQKDPQQKDTHQKDTHQKDTQNTAS